MVSFKLMLAIYSKWAADQMMRLCYDMDILAWPSNPNLALVLFFA